MHGLPSSTRAEECTLKLSTRSTLKPAVTVEVRSIAAEGSRPLSGSLACHSGTSESLYLLLGPMSSSQLMPTMASPRSSLTAAITEASV